MCSAHRQGDPAQWQAITGRIKAHGRLYAIVLRIREVGALQLGSAEALAAGKVFEDIGLPALAWVPEAETVAQWGSRVTMGFYAFAVTGRCESVPKARSAAQGGPANVGSLIPLQAAA
jgi:hypothetical protein